MSLNRSSIFYEVVIGKRDSLRAQIKGRRSDSRGVRNDKHRNAPIYVHSEYPHSYNPVVKRYCNASDGIAPSFTDGP